MAVPIPAGIRRDGLNMSQGEAHAAAGKISPCSSPRVGSLPATILEELPQEVGASCSSEMCSHSVLPPCTAAWILCSPFCGRMHMMLPGGADCITSKRFQAVGGGLCNSTMQ